ncbi:MAG: HAMP domain-containing histidine kinase [candidate division WOR-3 bacterium]|nr:HAMP domain-containing histidine kinase [candidate division WOR-3 bacterium]
MPKESSYPRDIGILAVIFISLIIFLALVNLYISIQLRKTFIDSQHEKIYMLSRFCGNYIHHPERDDFLKKIVESFSINRLVIIDSLGNRIYDSAILLKIPGIVFDDTRRFTRMPEPGKMIQLGDDIVYHNPQPDFYLYLFNFTGFMNIDSVFRWHMIYTTLSLILISFLGFFLIRNLFLPMRYVANLAKKYGIEMKKEDFVYMTFSEILSKIKEKEKELLELSAYIAHEFRNSLATITGLARLIEKGKKEPSEIIKECEVMESVISSLIEYSRPIKLLKSEFYLTGLLEESIQKANIPKKINIEKEYRYQGKIYADYELLLSALVNVLKNSADAIEHEGTIKLGTDREEDTITISIVDSGRGIAREELQKIFNPFYSGKKHGTGLGLAFVKKVVDIHDGKITVKSSLGKGTEFVIKIPLVS